jgi:hypothetical protein
MLAGIGCHQTSHMPCRNKQLYMAAAATAFCVIYDLTFANQSQSQCFLATAATLCFLMIMILIQLLNVRTRTIHTCMWRLRTVADRQKYSGARLPPRACCNSRVCAGQRPSYWHLAHFPPEPTRRRPRGLR